jgi:hypothetical protein
MDTLVSRDPGALDLEHVRGAEGLQVKGRGQPGGKKACKKVPAVRRSFFGHLERSNSLRDGDKPGTIFLEVSESVFFPWRKSEVNATIKKILQRGEVGQAGQAGQDPRSVNRVRRQLCGEERKGHRDHQELCSVNRVRRRL